MSDLFPKMNPILKWGLIIGAGVVLVFVFWKMFG